MILPISHERDTLLRWPVVTLTVIGLCLVVHLFSSSANDAEERFAEMLDYYMEHPYLELDSEVVGEEVPDLSGFAEVFGALGREGPDEELIAEEQKILNEKVRRLVEAMERQPFRRLGLTPSSFGPHQLFTHMFLHIGWLHLLGNLFILYLGSGPIEDVWGRPVFAVFYLSSGVFAALFFVAFYPQSNIPLVGASGAVSGVIGAFLVRFWKVKIKFFYFFWIYFRVYTGTFRAAAWIMLPLWLLNEIYWSYLSHHMNQISPETGGGVAYLAHIGGFVFGVAFAFGIRTFLLEERFFKPQIADKLGLEENPDLEAALKARAQGNLEEAWETLEDLLRRKPSDRDAIMALWDTGRRLKQPEKAAPQMMRLIHQELREGETDLGLQHWDEVRAWAPDAPTPPRVRALVALALLGREEKNEAKGLLLSLVTEMTKLPPVLVPRLAEEATAVDPALARELAAAGLAHPELPPEMRGKLESVGSAPHDTQVRRPVPIVPSSNGHLTTKEPIPSGGREGSVDDASTYAAAIRWVSAVPLSLSDEALTLHLLGREPISVKLDNLQALSAAQIREATIDPYFILDLFVDRAASGTEKLRAFRCSTRTFDPRHLLPAEIDAGQAFLAMVGRLLAGSGATLYPAELNPFRPQPFATYESLEKYEETLNDLIGQGPG